MAETLFVRAAEEYGEAAARLADVLEEMASKTVDEVLAMMRSEEGRRALDMIWSGNVALSEAVNKLAGAFGVELFMIGKLGEYKVLARKRGEG